MSSETFLSRWSRRKREVRQAERPPEDVRPAETEQVVPAEAAPEPGSPQSAGESLPPGEEELSAEEIAKLPSLEELTAETDLSGFLRKGVPEPLRNAALRRMWSLDPKIRDFVSEAREYAYDWNVPGGVPGSGPLQATAEEVARMAARIVGGAEFEPERSQDERSKTREQSSHPDQGEASPPNDENASSDRAPPGRAEDPAVEAAPVERAVAHHALSPESEIEGDASSGAPGRRHGGAMPL